MVESLVILTCGERLRVTHGFYRLLIKVFLLILCPHQLNKNSHITTSADQIEICNAEVKFLIEKGAITRTYFFVALNPSQREFFFKWGGETFQYVSMPFGLGLAPRVFTKLLKPIVGFLRKQGLRLVVYLDDILIIGHSEESTRKAIKLVVNLFESLGFVIQSE